METNPLNIRSVRPKAYTILKRAGMTVAQYHRSGQVRGWGEWSSGVLVADAISAIMVTARVGHFEKPGAADRLRDEAIGHLRAAGWTVADNGKIEALP